MMEKVTGELKKIKLIINSQKTKILQCNPTVDNATISFTKLDEDFLRVLCDNESHRHIETINF